MSDNKLWEGNDAFKQNSHLNNYQNWLLKHHNLKFSNYHELWKWSVDNIEDFWESVWNYFKITSNSPYKRVLSSSFNKLST